MSMSPIYFKENELNPLGLSNEEFLQTEDQNDATSVTDTQIMPDATGVLHLEFKKKDEDDDDDFDDEFDDLDDDDDYDDDDDDEFDDDLDDDKDPLDNIDDSEFYQDDPDFEDLADLDDSGFKGKPSKHKINEDDDFFDDDEFLDEDDVEDTGETYWDDLD